MTSEQERLMILGGILECFLAGGGYGSGYVSLNDANKSDPSLTIDGTVPLTQIELATLNAMEAFR